eukprot:gene13324-13453_t
MAETSSAASLAEGLEQQHVLQLLVQEAQQEIGNLRAELYSTRRLAEERRQGLDAMTNARDQLAAVVHQLEERVQQMHGHLMQLPVLQQELQNLQELHKRLQRDSEAQLQARRILETELQDERAGRSAAEEARAKAEAERSRLQLAQDDMMSQLRVARQKAADAEDEQLKAEEEAAVLRRELGVLQSQGSLGAAGPAPAAGGHTQHDSIAASFQTELDAQHARVAVLTEALGKVKVQGGSVGRAAKGSATSFDAIDENSGDEAAAVLEEQVELLMSKLVVLKKSRDRMLAQLDRQSLENEQLLVDCQALADSAQAAQQECQQWQEQARDALATVAWLQDLLAESASWEASTAAAAGTAAAACTMPEPGVSSAVGSQDVLETNDRPGAAEAAAAGGSAHGQAGGGTGTASEVTRLHAALLQEQSKLTQRDLQVRVLSAQLLRAYGAYRGVARSLVPVLSSVEGRLLSLKAASSLMLRSGT